MLKLAKFSFSHFFSNLMYPRWNELRVFCCVFAVINTVIVKHLRQWQIFHVATFCFDTVHNGIKIKSAICSNCQNCLFSELFSPVLLIMGLICWIWFHTFHHYSAYWGLYLWREILPHGRVNPHTEQPWARACAQGEGPTCCSVEK